MTRCIAITLRGTRCKLKCQNEKCHIHCFKEPVECSICISPVITKLKLQCGHSFCKQCIFSWLLTKQSCPYCRCGISANETQKVINYGLDIGKIVRCTLKEIDLTKLSDFDKDLLWVRLHDVYLLKSRFISRAVYLSIIDKIINNPELSVIFEKVPYTTRPSVVNANSNFKNGDCRIYCFKV